MRVALLAGHPNGAIDQVMQTLKVAVAPLGVEADVLCVYKPGFDENLDDYDLVHCGYFAYFGGVENKTYRPITANVWHVGNRNEEKVKNFLARSSICRIVVDDVMTLQQLGQENITSVVKIPLPVNPEKWHHLPTPSGEFKVGVFCNDYPYKRWQVVVQAAKKAGVKCLAFVMPEGRSNYDLDPLKDVYANVHGLISATFVDTNSLPLREALLCGRPVITTQNDGMGRVLKDGVNGYWFDGSQTDLTEKILLMKENYEALAAGARATTVESLPDIASAYKRVWEKVIEEYGS